MATSYEQWIRKCSLVVADGLSGLDLSSMRIKFRVHQAEVGQVYCPNSVFIRIYNLSDDTAKRVQKQFSRVVLQAGYEPSFGIIFDGTIKQVRRGRESPTDTYLDILGADGDQAFNFATINQTLAPGSSPQDQVVAAQKAMGTKQGYQTDMPSSALSRPKVMYGMARDVMTGVTTSNGKSFIIQNGEVIIIDQKGYLPGGAVKLTSGSGMIGLPEQTQEGIRVRALLNPNIKIGGLVQIDNASVQRMFLPINLYTPGRLDDQSQFPNMFPKISDDGFYRVFVAEFEGDTRGHEWYVDITCLAVDRSAPANNSVKAQ